MEKLDQLENILKVLFCYFPVQKVLIQCNDKIGITEEEYVQFAYVHTGMHDETAFSKEDFNSQCHYYMQELVKEYKKRGFKEYSSDKLNPIECLFYYVERMLKIDENEVVCRYERLMNWQRLTLDVNSDALVAAYLAMHKVPAEITEVDLSWKLVLGHDNHQLKRILNRGLAENHFHLYGSAPVFHLSWLSLMNSLIGSKEIVSLSKYDRNQMNAKLKHDNTLPEIPLRIQHLLAVCIRLILFMFLNPEFSKQVIPLPESNGSEVSENEWLSFLDGIVAKLISVVQSAIYSNDIEIYELEEQRANLQTIIDLFRDWYDFALPDYALLGSPGAYDEYNGIFQGERWLLYKCFTYIRYNRFSIEYTNLFYAYLLLKENFRHELIKFDDRVGFSHFQDFERRKFDLLDGSIFKGSIGAAARAATRENLLQENMLSLEVRVTPVDTAEGNLDLIRNLDRIIGKQKDHYFYTFHFLKRRDDWHSSDPDAFYCRHYNLRRKLQRQTSAIEKLRERYPNRAARVLGIDAASQEIGCRPEVFAIYFRYLHSVIHTIEDELGNRRLPQLRKTYHVGEDFLDVVDGLRAIDEAVRFLGMESGDRIGHALALGVDVKEWYTIKNNLITLPQQDYLDNIAWLYHMILKYEISGTEALQEYLKREFSIVFNSIYSNNMSTPYVKEILNKFQDDDRIACSDRSHALRQLDFNIFHYYSAWKLRSDDPTLYELGYYQGLTLDTEYDKCRVNTRITRNYEVRYIPEVFLINYFYHYSKEVRIEGEKTIQKEVADVYVDGVTHVQRALQGEIGRRGLAIETNPTSNLRIGTIRKYSQHPILNFYNRDLEVDDVLLEQNPQLLVSINTDDKGIFSTSLENEYAVMACALENLKNEDGRYRYPRQRVYAWLNSIRMMGIDQSFGWNGQNNRASKLKKYRIRVKRT